MTATDQAAETDHSGHVPVPDSVYIKIALLLGVLTGIEVFTYFQSVHQASDALLIITLVVLMVVKFFLVAAYFMHLKYDNAIFTKFIVGGLVLAYPVYSVFAFASGWLADWHWAAKTLMLIVPPTIATIWFLFAWQGGDHDDDSAH